MGEHLPYPRPGRVVRKEHECPQCGTVIASEFNGFRVSFIHLDTEFSACAGMYVSIRIFCPECGKALEFKRGELEE